MTLLGLPKRLVQRARRAAYEESRPDGSRQAVHSHNAPGKQGFAAEEGLTQKHNTGQNMASDARSAKAGINRIKGEPPKKPADAPRCMRFNVGDSVLVYPQKDVGIVYKKANEKGEVGVQVKKKKLLVNHKRLKLQVPASELYPDNYDFSVIFDSVANRKARRVLEKRHDPNLVIELDTNERGEPV